MVSSITEPPPTSHTPMQTIRELHFGLGKRLPLVLQTEASECGLACIAMVAAAFGHLTGLAELRKRFPISLKGATLEQLITIADQMGFVSRAVRLELDELSQLKCPAILHWNLNHFVVLKEVKGKFAHIHDPAVGELKLPLAQVSDCFTGVALELSPGITFQRKRAAQPLRLSHMAGQITGLKRGLLQILLLALALEGLALLMPIITQWITDEAIVRSDNDLLAMLSLGLVALGMSMTIIGAVRSWIGLYISTNFNIQWMGNVMGHLLGLPVDYFERRHLGDIVSRFGAVHAIERSLTGVAVESVLDGFLALGTLLMMLLWSRSLASVTIGAVLLYAIMRFARYNGMKLAQTGVIAKSAKEQSYFLETIRGARSIKLNNRENERSSAWMNLLVDTTNANLTMAKLNLFFGSSWSILSTLERAAVLWLGAHAVIRHDMSLGMLFAFLGYKEQFAARVNLLIDRFIEFKMLGVQTERLADIVLSQPEENFGYRKHDVPQDLTLSFERVDYRYSQEDPLLLNAASLTIKPGECIAIVGPSGCGKTTALKLMLGILTPKSGQIKLGGEQGLSLKQLGMRQYRNLIGTVMQDDQLFAGSLFDNICFLDDKPDEAWMIECAKTAHIHDEILAMPMGYHTLVGDMGTILSGGQKQRVLLARALYRRPKILFLDEATSHLDVENEAVIGRAIAALSITRIMIAHRPQTIAIADRVLSLENGQFIELPRPVADKRPDLAIEDAPLLPFPVLYDAPANTACFRLAAGGGATPSAVRMSDFCVPS